MRATGIQWAFAPCVTVPQDIRWGRTYEGFSRRSRASLQVLGAAAVRGLQGARLWPIRCARAGLRQALRRRWRHDVRHRARAARARPGRHALDEATLRRIHLPGYITAIEAGVGTIMPSYSSWNGVKCSASKRLLTEILKKELGFEGFLISDYNAIDQITPDLQRGRSASRSTPAWTW